MSSGTTHFHEMRVFVRLCIAAHHLFARTDEVHRHPSYVLRRNTMRATSRGLKGQISREELKEPA